MMTLIHEGGAPMWFVLAFGALGLLTGAHYAFFAWGQLLPFIRWMMLATLFSVCAGTWADLGATFAHVSRIEPFNALLLLEGLAESTSPGIMGFSLLALTAMFVAVGQRRAGGRPIGENPR